MRECCTQAANTKFEEKFKPGPGLTGGSFETYLGRLAEQWGPLVSGYASAFTVRTIDQIGLDTAAKVLEVKCSEGHSSHLIVVNERLYFFIWRANLAAASYWKLDADRTLVARQDTGKWPTAAEVDQVSTAHEIYLGKKELSADGLAEFNRIVFGSDKAAQLLYKQLIDISELFVLLHECSHVLPAPGFKIAVELPSDLAQVSPKRRARWQDEMQTDASAMYLLVLSASSLYEDEYDLEQKKALEVGAGIVYSGVDAALHTLLVLEGLRGGNGDTGRWLVDPLWARHPPMVLRRNTFGFASEGLAQRILDPAAWHRVRASVASLNMTRQRLFDQYLESLANS